MTAPFAPVTPEEADANYALLEHEIREYAAGRSDRPGGWVIPVPAAPPALCACAWGCARPVYRCRYGRCCYRRWCAAGRPPEGPPPPARATLAVLAEREAAAVPPPDVRELRGVDMRSLARDWIRCTRWADTRGLDVLAARVTDWRELAGILAECASPERALILTAPRGPVAVAAAAPVQGHRPRPVRPAAAAAARSAAIPAETKEVPDAA
jgi:hypothetical protein